MDPITNEGNDSAQTPATSEQQVIHPTTTTEQPVVSVEPQVAVPVDAPVSAQETAWQPPVVPTEIPQPTSPTVAQPPVQPVYSEPIQPTVPQSDVPYESNPFKVTVTGLITILRVNPMPALLIALVLLVALLASWILSFVLVSAVPIIAILLMIIIMLLVVPVVTGAYTSLAVNSIKGQSKKTGQLYADAFKKVIPLIAASILIGLIVVLGLILFIIPGIIFAGWFSLTFMAMFDENLGTIAAMKRSKQLAKGHVIEIIGAIFAGGLMGGTLNTAGAGLLAPAVSIAPLAGRYQQLKVLHASGAPKPKIHWLNYLVFVLLAVVIAAGVALSVVIRQSIEDTNKKNEQTQLQFYNSSKFNSNFDSDTNSDFDTQYDSDFQSDTLDPGTSTDYQVTPQQ